MELIVAIVLFLNVVFLSYVAFFKKDAMWLETLKAGGTENFSLVQELYTSDSYKAQQSDAIQQGLESFGIK